VRKGIFGHYDHDTIVLLLM